MSVIGKELVDYRDIRVEDYDYEVTLEAIADAYLEKAGEYDLPLAARMDEIYYGLLHVDEDCLLLYHPEYERKYSKVCIRCSHQGILAVVRICFCDISKQTKKAYAAQEQVGGKVAAGLLVGGAVGIGYAVGTGISKMARAAGRNQSQFDAEMDWLRTVDMLTEEIFPPY